MNIRRLTKSLLTALLALPLISGVAIAYELSIPSFDYRTGPYAPSGIPYANGFADYFTMLNERDGGINGAKIALVPCETGYNTKKGV
ncbi:MAG TPA: ABC transporter substrate-binding protein, partial [Gammaproteobacteria bacterium]|nr:ABC transporter substrate-binding protein [Gammaproteobacteria bacterium]